MTDGPSRLELLHFARRVIVQQAQASLAQVDAWIADEERRQAERERGRQARPPSPDWLLERGLNSRSAPVYVHAGGCWNAGKRSDGVSREQAVRALAEGVPACSHCRPDTELGFVDG
ncbi:hypothetical protein H114_32664 [Streptomyces gancidicus BKS 13-15]|uniref:Uncharacterized protein n=1 Tax=Streptomyces gancidicus BKS 13-15 TaxID=1284664 RepID=M3B9H7_STREZ|nr:DUF6233 domain-containing protein [Streptomyces gancidicus]EMF20394.1 hypothetical protein H114_32664 [Streptomyces gancidicus BKS 13-15]